MVYKKLIWLLGIGTLLLAGCSEMNGASKLTTSSSMEEIKIQTNTNPAVYRTTQEQANAIYEYPDLYTSAVEAQQQNKELGMYTIPGLLSTETLQTNQSNILVNCAEMTPQGVTVAGDYLLISSYCHDHEHNSVVYVINKETHKYIKTIILQGYPHVGGITYDPIAENIWVCARYDQKAEIVAFPMTSLEKYNLNSKIQPIEYTQRVELPQLKRASVITYANKNIYIGYFDDLKEGVLETYPIDEKGNVSGELSDEQKIHTTIDTDESEESVTIVRELQGITFYKDKFLVTQSYGAFENSKLLIFNYKKEKEEFLDHDVEKVVELPAHAEQITAIDNQLYTIFESAAQPYRVIEKVWVDRVLSLDLEKLI